IAEAFASNVGGTATLIGDPPNIMIGSFAGLDFMDFIKNDYVIILIILFITTYLFVLIYKRKLHTTDEAKSKVMSMNEYDAVSDHKLLKKSIIIITLTMLGFLLHGALGFESATIAIAGAVALLLSSGIRPEKIFREVEWKTIFFFVGLFIIVGGVKEAGIIKMMSEEVINITHGNLALTALTILWVSAIASAFIDNIPFVATMMPMIKDLGAMSGMNLNPLWWALSLGACLGGNGTIIGASANVVACSIAEEHGHKITFRNYLKVAFPIMLVSVIISTVYLVIFYLI
ncbi:MAG: SLC13 family permease, partial [Bacillota bacterium]|nr:SLC13 family permease [Bacillota bacterium]